MLKYLIIMLDDTAGSFCHYQNDRQASKLIDLQPFKNTVLWAMKENLNVQFLYGSTTLPDEYKEVVDSVDHVDIVPINETELSVRDEGGDETAHIIRFGKKDLCQVQNKLIERLQDGVRVNAIITDIESFGEEDFKAYKSFLDKIADAVVELFKLGKQPQLNILTDRIMQTEMNNCNAGVEVLAVAPDGKFYVCPAYYLDGMASCGSPEEGIKLPNEQLYKLGHAPICRVCDAYHCHRCVWLNQKTTREVNTPSRQQCVIAHLERNASQKLLNELRKIGNCEIKQEIPSIDYLDPFENIRR